MSTQETCQGCKQPKPNVGPWEDGRRLCGSCKAGIWASNGGAEALKQEIEAVLATEPAREAPNQARTPPKHRRQKLALTPLHKLEVGARVRVTADFGKHYSMLIGQRKPQARPRELRLTVLSLQRFREPAAIVTCTGEIRDAVSGWVAIPGVCEIAGTTREQLLNVAADPTNTREPIGMPGMANPWIGASHVPVSISSVISSDSREPVAVQS